MKGFSVAYSPELAQYVVRRAGMEIVPTRAHTEDDAQRRASALCVALNKVYGLQDAPAQLEPARAPVDGDGCLRSELGHACTYPYCACPLAYVPVDVWMREPRRTVDVRALDIQAFREADGAGFAEDMHTHLEDE